MELKQNIETRNENLLFKFDVSNFKEPIRDIGMFELKKKFGCN